MAKARSALAVSAIDRDEVGHWLSAHGTPQQVSLRGQIILAAADGPSDSAIARALAIMRRRRAPAVSSKRNAPSPGTCVKRSRQRTSEVDPDFRTSS